MSGRTNLMQQLRTAVRVVVAGLAAIGIAPTRADSVSNPISQFDITVDGQFTGGLSGGALVGEWSDVDPLAFISPMSGGGTLFQTNVGNPLANSLLYAAIAPGTVIDEGRELYLMYDYLPRTNPDFAPGEFIADVSFPIRNAPGFPPEQPVIATVQFRGAQIIVATGAAALTSPYDVFVTLEGSQQRFPAAALGIEGALDMGPSTLSSAPHLLVELEVPLRVPAGFLQPNDPGHDGVYSPDPAFWGASITNDVVDPPASSAVFQITPGGVVIASSNGLPFVPEPSTLALAAAAAVGVFVRRRRLD
jgi:PEP-CTERM motif